MVCLFNHPSGVRTGANAAKILGKFLSGQLSITTNAGKQAAEEKKKGLSYLFSMLTPLLAYQPSGLLSDLFDGVLLHMKSQPNFVKIGRAHV